MSAKIECYLDCVSPYSYFAFLHLRRNRQLLASHGVTVTFIPMFLGGIMGGSKNRPPWMNPVKQKYGTYDFSRAKKYFNRADMKLPRFFPLNSLYPQRCMVIVRDITTEEKYEAVFEKLWEYVWLQGVDISLAENLGHAIGEVLSKEEVEMVLQKGKEQEAKDKLQENTQKALELGAFGAPWMVVTNKQGKTQPFFGSDRFHFMWEFLGLPWEDVKIKEAGRPGEESKAKL